MTRDSYLNKYLSAQISKAGAKVQLNQEVTLALIEEVRPDVLIIATGVTPITPQIPGIDKDNVVLSGDVLAGIVKTGKTVAIIGGGEIGCETAEFLAEKGKKVTIVEMLDKLASGMEARQGRQLLLDHLAAKQVAMLPNTKVEEITERGLVVAGKEGKREVKAETIVLAVGSKPSTRLYEELRGKVPEIHLAGDCVEPRKILQAIDDGSRIARLV